jgi:hypothetical protein
MIKPPAYFWKNAIRPMENLLEAALSQTFLIDRVHRCLDQNDKSCRCAPGFVQATVIVGRRQIENGHSRSRRILRLFLREEFEPFCVIRGR